jgi:rare lipoprotein A
MRWFLVLLLLTGCTAPPTAPTPEGAELVRPTVEAAVPRERQVSGIERAPADAATLSGSADLPPSLVPESGAMPRPSVPVIDRGLASWYGGKFHGRLTASGERYDKNALTAAHRTLPFGTRVRVRSVHSGREVVVRINDRGPFRRTRIIDLSEAAFGELGLKGRGVTQVELLPE